MEEDQRVAKAKGIKALHDRPFFFLSLSNIVAAVNETKIDKYHAFLSIMEPLLKSIYLQQYTAKSIDPTQESHQSIQKYSNIALHGIHKLLDGRPPVLVLL